MRNIGMTLHVIHCSARRGIDNVKVNMDWQHLLMNGESLAEYAGLLAAEGLLGHQHANSGWGTFDDDNMVGATAFMETLELPLEFRRAATATNGERLGFDLYPYTEDAIEPVRRSVLQWRFIDSVAAKHRRRRAPRGAAAQGRGRAPTSSCTPRSARERVSTLVGLDVGTTGVKALAISPAGEVLGSAEEGYALSTPQPGWAEQDPDDWWRASQRRSPRSASTPTAIGFSGQMHGLVALDEESESCARRSSGTTSALPPNARRSNAASASTADRADGQSRAHRVHGAEAPVAAPDEPDVYARTRRILLPKDYVRFASPAGRDRRRRCVRHAALRRRAPALEREVARRARGADGDGSPPVSESARSRERATRPRGARRRDRPSRAALGRARNLGRRLRSAPGEGRPGGTTPRVLPRGPETWHAMGVMLSAAGSFRWLRDAVAPARFDELVAAAATWEPGTEAPLPALPRRRAHAAPRPRRPRGVRRASRCATIGARWFVPCSRALHSACGLARAAADARRRRNGSPRLGRRHTQRAVARAATDGSALAPLGVGRARQQRSSVKDRELWSAGSHLRRWASALCSTLALALARACTPSRSSSTSFAQKAGSHPASALHGGRVRNATATPTPDRPRILAANRRTAAPSSCPTTRSHSWPSRDVPGLGVHTSNALTA